MFKRGYFRRNFSDLEDSRLSKNDIEYTFMRKVRGDSYTYAKRLLKLLYEHYTTKSAIYKMNEILNFD